MAPADEAETREPGEPEHEETVRYVAEPVPGDQAQRHQPPKGGIAETLWVGAVESAEQRPRPEQGATQVEDILDRDHARPPSVRRPSVRSRRRRREPWMMKAAIAVGIAHTANSSGERMMP